jgi:hypothetical protein
LASRMSWANGTILQAVPASFDPELMPTEADRLHLL